MRFGVQVMGIEEVQRRIARLRPGADWRDLWREIAGYGLKAVQEQMRSADYPKPYWLLTTIRSNVKKGGQIKTIEDARATVAQPLADSGSLRRSWSAAHNTVTGTDFAEVGTHLPYADIHQTGGQSPFSFDADKEHKFNRNVAEKIGGAWNPDYFKMKAMLRKISRRGYINVRPRPQIPPDFPNQQDQRRIMQIIGGWIQQTIGGE